MNNVRIAINHLKVGNISKQHIDLAIDALEKQLPKKVIRDSIYSPALCPTCHTSEICKDLGDGYYRYLTDIKYCPECGQLLDWN